ncbi:GNAT family N-acetyltransferase [Streptomyces sp. NPDC058357]|uniref:GNAT family N-acetyltransferase n=1 Tax=unclassified Streptomyces TaxID=2593676 RepID=UPI00364F6CD9
MARNHQPVLGLPNGLELRPWCCDDAHVEELGLHRLRLCHSMANPASCRVVLKAGYAVEGVMRGALLHADGWHDQHLHARLRGDAAGPL